MIDPAANPLVRLADKTLDHLPEAVLRPTYDRSRLTPGIVHIGLGNFHRAHQSWYLHRLMQQGLAHDWAIIGASVRAQDEQQRRKLAEQDFLTTLILLDPDETGMEVIGSMIGYVPIEESNGALIDQMTDPAIRIVALTVTEGGYYLDPATGAFDASHPDIQHDAADPGHPRTAFGAIIGALARRRADGSGPFTLQSCDNLQGNGAILRQTVVSLARLVDADLAEWIDRTCGFPNSMVDCIVPATGPKERQLVQEWGIDDQVPVTHEAFRQWVIEDDFRAGRPDWDLIGATFSDRVHDFEAMKIRILNCGHQVISNAGEILSLDTISACMGNPGIRALFARVAREEIGPHLKPVPGMTVDEYVSLIDKRFSNPRIVDTTRRVAFDGSSRHPGFVLPSIWKGLEKGTSVSGLALVEAAWARMCEGTREDGSRIEPNDPFWDDLTSTARAARSHPMIWLEMRKVYGDLANEPRFADAFSHWLTRIWADGIEAAIQDYVRAQAPRMSSNPAHGDDNTAEMDPGHETLLGLGEIP